MVGKYSEKINELINRNSIFFHVCDYLVEFFNRALINHCFCLKLYSRKMTEILFFSSNKVSTTKEKTFVLSSIILDIFISKKKKEDSLFFRLILMQTLKKLRKTQKFLNKFLFCNSVRGWKAETIRRYNEQ